MKNDKKFFEEYKMDLIPLSADIITTSYNPETEPDPYGDDNGNGNGNGNEYEVG